MIEKKPHTRLAIAFPLVCGSPVIGEVGCDDCAGGGTAGRDCPQDTQNWLPSELCVPHREQYTEHSCLSAMRAHYSTGGKLNRVSTYRQRIGSISRLDTLTW